MKNVLFLKGKREGEVHRLSDAKARALVRTGFADFMNKNTPINRRGKDPKPLMHPSNPNVGASGRGNKPNK